MNPFYRCCSCFFPQRMLCKACARDEHTHSPLHLFERWTGHRFDRAGPQELGIELHLGHQGLPCPTLRPRKELKKLKIVDIIGVHQLDVFPCVCADALSYSLQLLHHNLFPASDKLPQTAFTFQFLKYFHAFNLEAAVAMQEFDRVIQRLTSSICDTPQTVSPKPLPPGTPELNLIPNTEPLQTDAEGRPRVPSVAHIQACRPLEQQGPCPGDSGSTLRRLPQSSDQPTL